MQIPIIDRYLFREIALAWLAVSTVLFTIMISNALLRVLVKTSGGGVAVDSILPLLAATSIDLLATIVPLGLYLGVMLGLGRLYQDSEMVVMSACGVGASKLCKPVLVLGVLGILITMPLTTLVSPWAERWQHAIKMETNANRLAALMQAGKFVESQGGKIVLFAQSLSDEREMQEVFMRQRGDDGQQALEVAESARYQVDRQSGDQYLVFENGERTTFSEADGEHQIISFAKHGVRVPSAETVSSAVRRAGKPVEQLLESSSAEDHAEFYWRIGIPFAAPLLALLAVPLSHTSPRSGRYGKVAIAIVIYIAYANMLILSRKWIAAEQIPAWLGLWWVHTILFVVTLILLKRHYGVRRHSGFSASAA